jgi:hypothetical protein
LKPAQTNSLWDPISKKTFTKRAGGMASGIGPEFKPQYRKKKKKKKSEWQTYQKAIIPVFKTVPENMRCKKKNEARTIKIKI